MGSLMLVSLVDEDLASQLQQLSVADCPESRCVVVEERGDDELRIVVVVVLVNQLKRPLRHE
ncbi:MAG: hypothetical protein ACW96N_08530 [Candidatus Thorarchaeota archaeon]